jgi:hypothetical protein
MPVGNRFKINLVLFAYIPNVEDLLHTLVSHQPIKIKKVSSSTYSESHVPAKIESPDSGTLSSPQKIQMIVRIRN